MAGDVAIVLSIVCPIPVSISIHHLFPRVRPRLWRLSHGSWCSGTRGSPELRVLLVPAVTWGHREGRQEAGGSGGLARAVPGDRETQ